MKIKTFEQVFESYFHKKYSFHDFINYKPTQNINFKINNFQSYSFVSYLKDKNGKLVVEAKKLKDYHSFLNILIFKKSKIHDSVYSYKDNKSIYDLVYTHKDSKNYFKTDIENFFGSISREIVFKIIKNNLEFFNTEIKEEYIDKILNLVFINNSLPIGFITSPSISNSVLYDFDEYIFNIMKDNDVLYSRYSDDLIFSSNDYMKLKNIEGIIKKYFDVEFNCNFVLNDKKTKFMDKTNKVQILGLIVTPNGHITVEKERKENIQKLIYFYKSNKEKFSNFLNQKYEGHLNKAYGSLNYINDIDKKFILKLRKKYGNFIIDKFLHGKKS